MTTQSLAGHPRAPRPAASPRRLSGHRAAIAAWAVVALAIPYYVFASGLPQPADMAMAVLLGGALALRWRRVSSRQRRPVIALLAYVGVVSAVNLVWSVAEAWQTADFMVSTAFVFFNAVMFSGFIALGAGDERRLLQYTGWSCALSLIAQYGLSLLFPELAEGARLKLFFNNPNQLAYYVLGAMTLVFVAAQVCAMPRLLVAAAAVAGGFIEYQTYSRAALFGYVALIGLAMARRPGLALAVALPAMTTVSIIDNVMAEDALWQMRLEEVQEGGITEYVEDRGLGRIARFSEHVFLGAGEGLYTRFHPLGLELHSSFANILFSYGLLGASALILFGHAVLRRLPVKVAVLLAPSILYSLFHNGMRFRVFWLVLGAAVVAQAVLADSRVGPTPRSNAGAGPGGIRSIGRLATRSRPRDRPRGRAVC